MSLLAPVSKQGAIAPFIQHLHQKSIGYNEKPNSRPRLARPQMKLKTRLSNVGYIPTPPEAISAMLSLAKVGKRDRLYDLGSGDGRILITAAQQTGCTGIGLENDPKLIQIARENARRAGVADRLTFIQQNVLDPFDISPATVVFIYLLPIYNLTLKPRLLQQLKPGTRIISLDFDMGDWQPQSIIPLQEDATLYYWLVP